MSAKNRECLKSRGSRCVRYLARGLALILPKRLGAAVTRFLLRVWFGTGYIDTQREDGRWVCLDFNEIAHLLHGPDHKRFGRNNFFPVMLNLVKSGTVVIDIGTSYGDEVIELSDLAGKDGMVYALEPNPLSFRSLKRTVALNKLANVVCINAAAGASNGTLTIEDNEADCVSLDSVWSDKISPRPVSFIKIDTDGHEMQVIRGAENLLAANPDSAIIAEYLPRINYDGSSGVETLKRYRDQGFMVHKIQVSSVPLGDDELIYLAENMVNPSHMLAHDVVLTRR